MVILKYFPWVLIIFLVVEVNVLGQGISSDQVAQQDISNPYYSDYSDLLALRISANTKFNSIRIIKEGLPLILQPNSPTSLGVGFNYKSYGLFLGIGLPKSSSSNEIHGKTKRFDLQVNMHSKKFGFDGFAQIYKGYYNSNPEDFISLESNEFPQLPDMKMFTAGLNAFRILNPERFSYKAAFTRNQVQLQSAGTFTLGVFANMDEATTDNGFIPMEFPDSIRQNFDLKSFRNLAFGVSVGYLYTWVISDHFFWNFGITPGFGYHHGKLESINGKESLRNSAAAQLVARLAIGYESRYLYMGLTGKVNWRNFKYKGYDLDLTTEQFKIFVGKRFEMRKNQ